MASVKNLKNIVAIVGVSATQVSFGIIAGLLQQGAIVVVPAQRSLHLELLRQYLKNINTEKLVTFLTDLPDYDKAVALVETILDAYGPLEMVVFPFDNTAAGEGLANISVMQWQRAVEENLSVYFICCRVILNAMKKRGGGMFVAIIDIDGKLQQADNDMATLLMDGQMKMANSFYNEVKNSPVKFHHLFIDNPDTENDKINSEAVAHEVLSLYNNEAQADTDGPFIHYKAHQNTINI